MSRNRVIGGFEELVEQGQSNVTKAAKQTITDFAGSTKGQITGNQNSSPAPQGDNHSGPKADHGTNEAASGVSSQNQGQPQKSDEDRIKFLKDLYGGGEHKEKSTNSHSDSTKTGVVKQALGISEKDPNKGLSPEEIAKLTAVRNRLHSDYYHDLVTPKQKEVSVIEKLEREDQVEQIDAFEKQKKKPQPINPTLKQGTAESSIGTVG